MAARFSWALASVGARSDGPPVVKLGKMGAEEFPGVLRGLGWGRAATEQRCDEEEA
jgi:hypothetical protein